MTTKLSNNQAGMMLLETIGYVFVFAIVLNLAAGVFITCSRMSAFGVEAFDRVAQAEELGQAFADAVHTGYAVSPGVGGYRTGSECVVLRTRPPDGTDADLYTVFGPVGPASKLSKIVIRDEDGTLSVEFLKTYPIEFDMANFVYNASDVRHARLVTLELTPATDRPRWRENRPRRFTAALRGIQTGLERANGSQL